MQQSTHQQQQESSSSSTSLSTSTSTSTASPSPSPAHASTFFKHGVNQIFSYLTTREWNSAARVSRHWFHVAATTKSHGIIIIPEKEIFREESQVEGMASTENLPTQPEHRWSLLHQATTLELVCTLDPIANRCAYLTNLRTLRITLTRDLDERGTGKTRIIPLPPSLTSLTISLRYPKRYIPGHESVTQVRWDAMKRYLAVDVESLIKSTPAALTELTLNDITVGTVADFPSLNEHPYLSTSLKTLKLVYDDQYFCAADAKKKKTMQQIGYLTSLTSLTIGLLSIEPDALDEMLVLSHLTNLDMIGMKLDTTMLRTLHRLMPNLRYLKSSPSKSTDLTAYTAFEHLRNMHFLGRPTIGTTVVKNDAAGEESLVNVFCTTLSPLESLKFQDWYFREITSWLMIETKFPLLCELYLEQPRQKQQAASVNFLITLINASSLCKRLTKLSIFYLPSNEVTFTLLKDYFSNLIEFRMKCISPDEVFSRSEVYRLFNTSGSVSGLLPRLTCLHLERKDLVIDYDRTGDVNKCRFVGLAEEEEYELKLNRDE